MNLNNCNVLFSWSFTNNPEYLDYGERLLVLVDRVCHIKLKAISLQSTWWIRIHRYLPFIVSWMEPFLFLVFKRVCLWCSFAGAKSSLTIPVTMFTIVPKLGSTVVSCVFVAVLSNVHSLWNGFHVNDINWLKTQESIFSHLISQCSHESKISYVGI